MHFSNIPCVEKMHSVKKKVPILPNIRVAILYEKLKQSFTGSIVYNIPKTKHMTAENVTCLIQKVCISRDR